MLVFDRQSRAQFLLPLALLSLLALLLSLPLTQQEFLARLQLASLQRSSSAQPSSLLVSLQPLQWQRLDRGRASCERQVVQQWKMQNERTHLALGVLQGHPCSPCRVLLLIHIRGLSPLFSSNLLRLRASREETNAA